MTTKAMRAGFGLVLGIAGCASGSGSAAPPASTVTAAPIAYRSGKAAEWPAESDAVVAAPKNHKVLFENEKVRVLDVTVGPGEVEPVHSHRWPSVLHILSAGDFLDRDASGKVIMDTRALPAPLTLPLTMWKDPEAPHSVENLSKSVAIHLVRVEMKP